METIIINTTPRWRFDIIIEYWPPHLGLPIWLGRISFPLYNSRTRLVNPIYDWGCEDYRYYSLYPPHHLDHLLFPPLLNNIG